MFDGKRLQEEKYKLLNKMNEITSLAEQRHLTNEERETFAEAEIRVRAINTAFEKRDAEWAKMIGDSIPQSVTVDGIAMNKKEDNDTRMIKNVILPNEKIEKRHYSAEESNMDFGELVKTMAGKGNNNSAENRYYRAMSSSGNKVVIPRPLSDQIIDMARSQSALFGNIPIVQMPHNNLRIAVQTQDAQANFVNENDLIPATEAIFSPVDLEGKTLAIFIPVSEQLLDSASNLSQQLIYSCSKAIAVALDKALLYGQGMSEDGLRSNEIKGLATYDTINKIEHTSKINYNPIIAGVYDVKKNNIEPTHICMSSIIASDLAMHTDANGQYIKKPDTLMPYSMIESNNMNDKEVLVYDQNSLLLGIHKGITIEFGHSADMFQRIQKGLRIYLRADMAVVRPKGVTLVNVKTIRDDDIKKEQD